MLALSVVQEIDRLLNEGKQSQRKIAARLRVSRATVSAIANGRRPVFGTGRQPSELDSRGRQLPPQRCPHCGFLVYMPCLVCRTREYRHERHMLRTAAASRLPSAHRLRRPPMRRGSRACHARVA